MLNLQGNTLGIGQAISVRGLLHRTGIAGDNNKAQTGRKLPGRKPALGSAGSRPAWKRR